MRPSIQNLFSLRGPTAVGWSVISVVINAVDGVFWCWFAAHIRKKNRVIIPSRIDYDAASGVIATSRIFATRTHTQPRFIFLSLVCLTVFRHILSLSFSKSFKSRASTIFRPIMRQMACMNSFFLSAFTTTVVIGDAFFGSMAKIYNSPAIKALTGYWIWHERLPCALYSTGGKP